MDLMATAVMSAVLVGAGLWNLVAVSMVRKTNEMLADAGVVAQPLLSRVVFQAAGSPFLQICVMLLLLVGFWVLFTTRDRLRGVVYAMAVSMMMGMIAVMTHLGSMIVWLQLASSLG